MQAKSIGGDAEENNDDFFTGKYEIHFPKFRISRGKAAKLGTFSALNTGVGQQETQ